MEYEQDIENLLADAHVPTVVPGPHRAHLKCELLSQVSRKETRKSLFKTMLSSPKRKIAFACCAALLLVASAWGAEKAYKKIATFFANKHESVIVDSVSLKKVMPDGSVRASGSVLSMSVGSGAEDPAFADEKARQQFEEMKELVDRGEYKFINSHLSSCEPLISPSGVIKTYIYKFTLANGEEFHWNFICPLEEVASWEEYRQKKVERLEKIKERFRQRTKATSEAIAAGRVRLIEIIDVEVHICKEVNSGKKLRVQRVVLANGDESAAINPYPSGGSVGSRSHSTSWQDHLAAIDNGTRELIERKINKLYMYEATLADGTTAKYGGGPPKKKETLEK